MALNHSKTWPVSTLAVVQLRVDPNGRTYSTQLDADLSLGMETGRLDEEGVPGNEDRSQNRVTNKEPTPVPTQANSTPQTNGLVLPLSQQHVEMFTRSHIPHPYKTTVRTDTVSTILEQDLDFDSTSNNFETAGRCNDDDAGSRKFHVLALARIEEATGEPEYRARRSSAKVDNWDLIYTEKDGTKKKRCPACTGRCSEPVLPIYGCKNRSPNDYHDRLLPDFDLPLDARKVMTLRRHYYPEGGWGWVIIVCTVLVHVLNVGLQLSCSQLAVPGADKFKTLPVHIVGE